MRVLVTGSAGYIGQAAIKHLQQRGWTIRQLDLTPPENEQEGDFRVCDITDFASVREAVRDCDAIVHMAAIRSPTLAEAQEVYRVNTVGTFNIFEAAAKEGIKRVVQASSINALGCAWNLGDLLLEYLPVDEAHPPYTTDPYAFSKQQIEAIGHYFWRREQISSVALRFPGIYDSEKVIKWKHEEHRTAMVQFLDEFLQLDETERERQLTKVRQQCFALRAGRNLEYPINQWNTPAPDGIHPQLWSAYTFARYNFWSSIDLRDVAQSIEDALINDYEGSHPLFITDSTNRLAYDSQTLAKIFFPDTRQTLTGCESLFSINRARELIGFEPQFSLNER